MQIILSIIVLIILAGVLIFLYQKRKNEREDSVEFRKNSIEKLIEIVKQELTEAIRDDEFRIVGDADYEAITRNKLRMNKALRNCVFGIPSEVAIVKAAIRDIIEKQLPAQKDINEVIDFGTCSLLEPMTKWELLVYILEQRLGNKQVIHYLEKEYKISEVHQINDGLNLPPRRCFDSEFLDIVFASEILQSDITYTVSIDVLVNLIFQKFKGLGCIDTLRSLPIDGFHYGTSGSVRYLIDGNYDIPYRSTNSIWVQINAKWVHFSFLDFHTEGEMARITNLISSWGHAAPMNEKISYKVNDAQDGARITTVRPPAGESWAAFVRMFSLSVRTMEWLLDKPEVHNWELPRKLIYFLMRAEETTAFTGQQNTGKTTMMASAIADVDLVNIRVLEMSFELALREAYPDRDILTVKPTDYVSSAELQDMLKKTDAYLSMVGEVAQDIVAARMIQFCIIASAFTIFSHHAKSDAGLIEGIAQSLVACGEYKDHEVAISTVLDAIKNNVHLNFMDVGNNKLRYIDYISEIHKEDTVAAYPEVEELLKEAKAALKAGSVDTLAQIFLAYTSLTREYYTRSTDRVRFTSRKIVEFNKKTLTYEPKDWYTPETMERILSKLHGEDKMNFLSFYYENWRSDEYNPYKKAENQNSLYLN